MLDAMGQKNEKAGIKWTKYFMHKWDKEQWEENQLEKDKLKKKTKSRYAYTELLFKFFQEKAFALDRPNRGYWLESGFSGKGIWVKLHDRFGKKWVRGIRPSGIPKYDHHAVLILVQSIEDKMWEVEREPQTETGVYLPS